jgi:hypothetical protein
VDYRVEKEWTSHGFPCVAVAQDIGHRCGYVGFGRYHRLFGVDYSQESALLKELDSPLGTTPESYFNVHGGITFAGTLKEHPGYWFFGFDCAHASDQPDPELLKETEPVLREIMLRDRGGTVWTLEMVAAECEKLARQLNDVMDGPVWIADEVAL